MTQLWPWETLNNNALTAVPNLPAQKEGLNMTHLAGKPDRNSQVPQSSRKPHYTHYTKHHMKKTQCEHLDIRWLGVGLMGEHVNLLVVYVGIASLEVGVGHVWGTYMIIISLISK